MTLEPPANIEKTLREVDRWLYYRFDENYTARFADGLKEEISAILSPELKDQDREDIINGYDKSRMSKDFQGYFSRQYILSQHFLDIAQVDDSLGDDDKRVVEKVVSAVSRVVKFVEDLCQNPELDQRAIEQSFVDTYRSPEEFSSAYLAMFELIIHEATRGRTTQTEEIELRRGLAELQGAMQEMERYASLLNSETLRIHQKFMPRVAKQVIGDLYIE